MLADASLLHSLAIGLVIAGVIILAFTFRSTLARPFRRFFGGSVQSLPRKSPSGFDAPTPGTAPSPLNAVMDDAEELAQLIADRLDRQAARLEQLIAAADDRLARLEQAAIQTQSPTPPPPRREYTDPLSRQIYDLSDRGLPPVDIARQLNQHTGKVELILALRQHS